MFAPDDILPESGYLVSRPFERKQGTQSGGVPQFISSYIIVKTFPGYGTFEYHAMEEITFKAIVRIDEKNLSYDNVIVEVFTNLRHLDNDEGLWHYLDLPYRGTKDDEHHVYGQVVVLIEDGLFDFVFKARTLCEKIGLFYPSENDISKLIVNIPRNLVLYAEILRVPYMSQIIGPLWGGNEWAGMMCIVNGFTHIMCVAEELPDPVGDFEGRCFCRAPFIQGTKNPLHREAYKRAVIWIKRSMRDGYKILVYSRHGFGRVGSVLVGFVMMENPAISYEDALRYTFERRPVLPHRYLKEICELIFRRPIISSDVPSA